MQRNHPLLANNLTNNGPVLFMLAGKGKKRRRLQRDERYRKFCERKEARERQATARRPTQRRQLPAVGARESLRLERQRIENERARKIAEDRKYERAIAKNQLWKLSPCTENDNSFYRD